MISKQYFAETIPDNELPRFLDWLILYRGIDIGRANDLVICDIADYDSCREVLFLYGEWDAWRTDPCL